MKSYRLSRFGIEIDFPVGWPFPHQQADDTLVLRQAPHERLNLIVGPEPGGRPLDEIEVEFQRYVAGMGWSRLEFGRIEAGGRLHVWARYCMPGPVWTKKYLVRLGEQELALTASSDDPSTFARHEAVWDAVAGSLRLIGQPQAPVAIQPPTPIHPPAPSDPPAPPADSRQAVWQIFTEEGADPEKRIMLVEQYLGMVHREEQPKLWAIAQASLAEAYFERRHGDRVHNLRQAIHYNRLALEAFDRQKEPEFWARTHNDLGECYRLLAQLEEQQANLERAIEHYQACLEVATRRQFPDLWAGAHNNLGIAYLKRVEGDPAENFELAIAYCRQALEFYTRQTLPEDWAMTQNNLGSAYRLRLQGERAENLEQAIHHFQLALEVQSPQLDPEQWAGTQLNLGLTYSQRLRGERAENVERAIFHNQQALKIFRPATAAGDYAALNQRLADLYLERVAGERPENVQLAIDACQQALRAVTAESHPYAWARAQESLGHACLQNWRSDRAQNLEEAIAHYQQALGVFARLGSRAEWAAELNFLAYAYQDRIHGLKAENLEQAIRHFEQALTVFTQEAFPEQWAATHNGLAFGYFNRLLGERADNLEQAIAHARHALQVYTQEAHPDQWALFHAYLGTLYQARLRGPRRDNLEQARNEFRLALQVYTRQDFPQPWQNIQQELAKVEGELGSPSEASATPPPPQAPGLTYPEFYLQESQRCPGEKRRLQLAGAMLPENPFYNYLLLAYEWEDGLPEAEAANLGQRAVAYVSCAIYDAAVYAGLPCQLSPIPNGRRPAWLLPGERVPVSLTLSDILPEEHACQLTIAPVVFATNLPPSERGAWEKLRAAFEARFRVVDV
jgi:tetratricopeptide (TPR) repeat protein